jgi:hypothetical protein
MKLIINQYGCFTEEEFKEVEKFLNGEIDQAIVDGIVYRNTIEEDIND